MTKYFASAFVVLGFLFLLHSPSDWMWGLGCFLAAIVMAVLHLADEIGRTP